MPAEFIKQIKAVHLPILVLFLLVTIGKVVAPTARVIYQKLRHDLETNTDPDVRAFLGLVLPLMRAHLPFEDGQMINLDKDLEKAKS